MAEAKKAATDSKKTTKKVAKAAKPAKDSKVEAEVKTPTPAPEAEVTKTTPPAEKETKSTKAKTGSYQPAVDLNQLLDAGSHFGHQARRWHPKMDPYIYQKRDGVHIFDLIKTAELLETAAKFAYEIGKNGKTIIFVGTKRQAKDIVREEAIQAGAMYVVNRWLGGFISNWDQVSKSIRRMTQIKKGLEEGTYKNYTKKERVLLEKEVNRLERFFLGVAELKGKPDALFVIDVGREKTAVKEANEANIPVIGFVDSNDDPTPINMVIPANDDAARSIKYIVHIIAEAYKAGKSGR